MFHNNEKATSVLKLAVLNVIFFSPSSKQIGLVRVGSRGFHQPWIDGMVACAMGRTDFPAASFCTHLSASRCGPWCWREAALEKVVTFVSK